MQFLYDLQNKPKHIRNGYALALASTFTGIVALVWFVGTASQGFLTSAELKISEGDTPFSNLIKQSKEQLANISGSTNKEEDKSEAQTGENPLNIALSEEDLEIAKQNQPDPTQVYISTSTIQNNNNSLFGNSERVYREVMVATTSSSSASSTKNAVDESATTSDRLF